MTDEKNILCIYHGNCADGFGAAWAVRKRFPQAEFYAGTYQDAPPDVTGRDVVLVEHRVEHVAFPCHRAAAPQTHVDDVVAVFLQVFDCALVVIHHKDRPGLITHLKHRRALV